MFGEIGKQISKLTTPVLLVDLCRFERNIRKLMKTLENSGVRARPHAKAHKCPAIAHIQISHGANGVCCQKLSEAESMVVSGVRDVLISNEVIGESKLLRLASLAKQAKVSVCVDDAQNVEEMSKVASIMGATIDVIIEVNVGQERCGVEPGEQVVQLAKHILALPNLNFKGIQTYQGWNQHVRKFGDRKTAVAKVSEMAKATVEALSSNNIPCEVVTGGGTGTYTFEAASGVFTEVQPGSYVFMDADYGKNLGADGNLFSEFEQSLYVLSTVISVTPGKRAILDAGMKALSLDSGPPLIKDHPQLIYHNGGDEHGIVKPSGELKVGDQVWLIPGHCDPTVNMHNWMLGVRNGMVETAWPITGRGPGI
ncbi:3-hydroxy-D-aspartate aldolase [Nematostella vectensis]|uniref:3-hydroxy-D-aspartate aldolase n=1 Tax=Nematostella vectensis TaxID=45351 RepID=UPI00138FE673|nr:3-hydroxy-D-aspartate aldolase [Nematostella vectensis]